MQTNQVIKNTIELLQSGLFAAIYLGIWFICNKKLKKGLLKAILIGLATSFFFYNFVIRFFNSIDYFLKFIDIHPGFYFCYFITFLKITIFAKPLSIFLGIIITLILLVEDDFINELRK